MEDIPLGLMNLHLTSPTHGNFLSPGLKDHPGLAPHDGPASTRVGAFGTLKEEGVLAIPNLKEG